MEGIYDLDASLMAYQGVHLTRTFCLEFPSYFPKLFFSPLAAVQSTVYHTISSLYSIFCPSWVAYG
jgi:hypothetical protein